MNERVLPWVKMPAEMDESITNLLEELAGITAGKKSEAEQRAAAQRIFKQVVREAFLTHYATTEEDFERCWPRLRDDQFCEHATDVLFTTLDARAKEWDDEDEE
ncbi:MAG: hypothetical protein M3371_05725 [Acidobacteriota bacterium]|nr:hypothetical protein [Acidobacteriota bacterium]